MEGNLYFVERTAYQASTIREIDKVFFYGNTKYQNVLIANSPTTGIFLALDRIIQSAEVDSFIYHETLVHTCVSSLENPKNVLVIGAGEGTTITELLKYKDINVDWVEIDGQVVKLCKKFLPYALKKKDKRYKLYVDDGIKYLKRSRKKYDIIFGDVIDGYSNPIAEEIYSEKFARLISDRLTDQGMYVTLTWGKEGKKWVNTVKPKYLSKVFKIVRPISFYMPGFGIIFNLIIASKRFDPAKAENNKISKTIAPFRRSLKYYNEATHRSLFLINKNVQYHP